MTNQHYPIKIGQEITWKVVSAGQSHSLAIKNDGTLWAWGSNYEGKLGDGTYNNRITPVQVGHENKWETVTAREGFSAAFKKEGSLWFWGNNASGQFGNGRTIYKNNSPNQLIMADTNSTTKIITVNSLTNSSLSQVSCNFFTWNQNNVTYTNSGVYKNIIMNAKGCDSTITLNLTINKLDTAIGKIQDSLFVNQKNATYQWLSCDSANAPISNATAQNFMPIKNGNYACEITTANCIDTTRCVQLVVSGIVENKLDKVAIYPNPFKDVIHFDFGNLNGETTIKVLNASGQLIIERKENHKNKFSLNTKNWSKGVYLLQLSQNQENKIIKLVK